MYKVGFLISFVVSMLSIATSCKHVDTETVRIATSANMYFTMKELVNAFELQTSVPCEIVVSSSGKLSALIRGGAPYDVFVAADMNYPQDLYKDGFTLNEPKPYAYGKLVLWTTTPDINPSMASLDSESIVHIAIANPRTAPYGRASQEAIRSHDLTDQINHKLVYAESVSQTNQFIISQSAEIGFTALSVVLTPEIKDQGQWIAINESSYSPLAQGAVLIDRKKDSKSRAKEFYDFLYSSEARVILERFGYSVDE